MATNQEKFDKLCADTAYIRAVVLANQKRIDAVPEKVWRGTTVSRAGKEVVVLQDLANGTTYSEQALTAINALKAIVEKSATGKTMTPEEVTAIIRETAAETGKTFADNTINVEVSVAAPEPAQQEEAA